MSDENPGLITVYLQLMKLRVVILLQVTAVCAILAHDLMVRSGSISGDRTWYDTLISCSITILGGTLAAGGSNAINMVYDRDIDPGMSRTRTRPIPNGWISPNHALIFGIIISIIGCAVFLPFHWKAAFWSLFSVIFYVFVYTIWLKRKTSQNIVIGGASGALPPVIGWAIATNGIALEPIILFLIIFIWTPSHFWALSLYKTDDYKNAKIPMLPVISGIRVTKINIFVYAIILLIVSIIPYFLNYFGILYLLKESKKLPFTTSAKRILPSFPKVDK